MGQNELLVKKWGSKIVDSDTGNDIPNKKRKTVYDINKRLRIPIPGV